MATWLIVYRPAQPLMALRSHEVVDADDVVCDGESLLLTRQELVVFKPRTVTVRRVRLDELASLCRLTFS